MDSLPQEIYDAIASFVPGPADRHVDSSTPSPRPAIAAVSKRFQSAIERLTFKYIRVYSTDLSNFQFMFQSRACRQNFISELDFCIVLPRHDNVERTMSHPHETESERKKNNFAASQQLRTLLDGLSQWRTGHAHIFLNIHTLPHLSESADKIPQGLDLTWRELCKYSYTELGDVEHMHLVSCVREFDIDDNFRQFTPKSIFALATRFPQVNKLHIYWEEPFGFREFRRDMRQNWIRSLKAFRPPPALRDLNFQITAPSLAVLDGPTVEAKGTLSTPLSTMPLAISSI